MVDLNITLPEGFLEEEERCGYRISRQMKEVWAVELDLLAELLRVCKKHDINVFALGGTLLGAVRHKGMIPWDDDIDMAMFRQDYERLCQIAPSEFKAPYFFQTEYTDPGTLRGHAQLRNSNTTGILHSEKSAKYAFNQGIFIDIFPLDSVVEDEALFQAQYEDAMKYRTLAHKYSTWSSRFRVSQPDKLKGKVKKLIGPAVTGMMKLLKLEQNAYRKYEQAMARYSHLETEMVTTLCLDFANKKHFKYRADFQDLTALPFEFMQIPAGKQYEHALTKRYGTWQVFEVGGSLHGEVLFDTDKPYGEYLK